MGLIMQTLQTDSMVTLLASLCAVLFGAIGYLYISKSKEIKEVRDEHLKDLRSRNETSTVEQNLMQTVIQYIQDIKRYIENEK